MTKTWDDVLKEKKIIGFNDRGIVMYNSETKDAVCQNCGELLHGEEYQFGHIGCPKPSGLYITNTATAEDIISAFYQIMDELREKISKLEDVSENNFVKAVVLDEVLSLIPKDSK